MGALHGIQHYRETVRRIDQITSIMKFVIVGDTATGKTSLLRRYISNKFSIASNHSVSQSCLIIVI